MADNIKLSLPNNLKDDIHYILDSTPDNRIYITSDWHLHAAKYGKSRNLVNTTKMISWCKNNIKDNDVFMYLGDLAFRYMKPDSEYAKDVQEKFKSLPGIKILILGNHDRMQGPEFYGNCGFDYIYEELIHHNIIFTHRPVNVEQYPHIDINIHGHIHEETMYFTTDGKDNVNVYNNDKPFTLKYLLANKDRLIKDNYWVPNDSFGESSLNETKRSNLPDSSFGIPEDRKFPLDTEQHVKSAIKLFGHAEESKKKLLAKRIRAAAKRYSIDIKDTSMVAKYLKENTEDPNIDEYEETILVSTDNGLDTIKISGIPHWYISNKKDIPEVNEDMFSDNINDAIDSYKSREEYDDKYPLYVFICNGHCQDIEKPWEAICVGMISLDGDTYNWDIQYPVRNNDGVYYQLYTHEAMALAGINPVKGIMKPIITKIIPSDENMTNTLYVFSTDMIADKYLVVNEGKLQVANYNDIKDYYIEAQYEFIGDILNFKKILAAYQEDKIVDNTFFYTALTGKPLLTEDQIDFDENFRKIDYEKYKLNILSELATFKYRYGHIHENAIDVPYKNSSESILYSKYKDFGLSTKYSINGYYVESSVLNKRSEFVNKHQDVTDNLIMSVIEDWGR